MSTVAAQIIIILTFPILLFSESVLPKLDGHWVEEGTTRLVKLKVRKNVVELKDVHGQRWKKFNRRYYDTFIDRKGNKIRIINNRRFVYTDRKGRRYRYHRFKQRPSIVDLAVERQINKTVATSSILSYYVREIHEHVEVQFIEKGLRARRNGQAWTYYDQRTKSNNEYIDSRGNTYRVRPGNVLRWASYDKLTSLTLEPTVN